MNKRCNENMEKSEGNNLKNNILTKTLLKLHKKECQVSNKVGTPDLTNRLWSGKITPCNGATDVAAFKIYLDEVKCRQTGGAAQTNGGLSRGQTEAPLERIPTGYDAWLPQP